MRKNQDKNTVYGTFTPNKEGKYSITANLFGYSVSKSIDVYKVDISASEVTTFTNVPVTFKVHLDGDKKHTANQKVKVSFFKDYELVTDENGDGSVVFDNLNYDIGKYRVDITVDTFKAQSAVNIITTIEAEDVVQVSGDHVTFKAQFTNSAGEFLNKSTKVEFLLDDTSYNAVIADDEGNALADFYSLSRGEHKVVVINPDNGEMKTYRIVILMGFGGGYNGTNNQNQETPDTTLDNSNSVNSNAVGTNSLFNDNGNTTNQPTHTSVSKDIENPEANGEDNNLWWIILAIIAIIAAGGIIKKYKG